MLRFTITALCLILLCNIGEAQSSMQNTEIAALTHMDISAEPQPVSSDNEPPTRLTPAATLNPTVFSSKLDLFSLSSATAAMPLVAVREMKSEEADFISFKGSFVKDLVRLNWAVRPNADALGFSIERRCQADEQWTAIKYFRADAKQNAAGYSFYDKSGVQGVTYYRIRQIASNGKNMPTPAVCVMPYIIPNSFVIWQHKVDPFTQFGTVSCGLGSNMPVSVTMFDAFGRNVAKLVDKAELSEGHHLIPFSTAALTSGVYSLQIETPSGVRTERISVL